MARDRDEEYDNTNRGVLFENTRSTSPRAPIWKGSCTIQTPDGELVEYWVSGWEQKSRKGDPFISLSFEEKEDQDGRGNDDRRRGGRDRDRDDDRRRDRGDDRRSSGRDRGSDRRSARDRRDDDEGDPRDRDSRGRNYGEGKEAEYKRDLDDEVPF